LEEAVKVPDQALIKRDGKKEAAVPETENGKQGKNPKVTKERIERLKRDFRPSWMIETINSPGKNSSDKKDK
jgi:hypothetical protein